MRREINAEGKRSKSNAIKNWSPPPQESTKTMSKWGSRDSIIVKNPVPHLRRMPEINRDHLARKPQKKQTNRTPRCPKIKRKPDVNKETSARWRDPPKSLKIVNHNSLPREATGSKRNRKNRPQPAIDGLKTKDRTSGLLQTKLRFFWTASCLTLYVITNV